MGFTLLLLLQLPGRLQELVFRRWARREEWPGRERSECCTVSYNQEQFRPLGFLTSGSAAAAAASSSSFAAVSALYISDNLVRQGGWRVRKRDGEEERRTNSPWQRGHHRT